MQQKVDYLIVGAGVAGICFAKQCIDHQKSFIMIADNKSSASHVAAGLFNPIVIKRFNPVWRTEVQMHLLKNTFKDLEDLLGGKYVYNASVYRVFSSEQEVRTWQKKREAKTLLKKYLNPHPITEHIDVIRSPHGFGEVQGTGHIDLSAMIRDFIHAYRDYIILEKFIYNLLEIKDKVHYKNIEAKHIIFAEGIKVLENPFFNFIPIIKNKGETLIIESHANLPNVIFNSKTFLMPLCANQYYVGSTYDREWEEEGPTEKNKQKLIKNLTYYFKGDYKIIEHRAAFRPTTPNLRPIVGMHPVHQSLYVLNGMGTRGTFNAPDMSKALFNFIEYKEPLIEDTKVDRYYDMFK